MIVFFFYRNSTVVINLTKVCTSFSSAEKRIEISPDLWLSVERIDIESIDNKLTIPWHVLNTEISKPVNQPTNSMFPIIHHFFCTHFVICLASSTYKFRSDYEVFPYAPFDIVYFLLPLPLYV